MENFNIGDMVVWSGHNPVIGMVQATGVCEVLGCDTVNLGGKHTACGTGNYLRKATESEEKCFLLFTDFPLPVYVGYMTLVN